MSTRKQQEFTRHEPSPNELIYFTESMAGPENQEYGGHFPSSISPSPHPPRLVQFVSKLNQEDKETDLLEILEKANPISLTLDGNKEVLHLLCSHFVTLREEDEVKVKL